MEVIAKTVKILHCSDLHLGRENRHEIRLGNKEAYLTGLRALAEIIRLANEEQVDLLLISGDLFDRIHVDKKIVDTVIAEFQTIPDIKIFIAPGNHDPFTADSYYNLRDWPDNVHIFKGKLSPVVLEDRGLVVWGSGFTGNFASNLWELQDSPQTQTENTIETFTEDTTEIISESPTESSMEKSLRSPTQIKKDFSSYINLCVIHGDIGSATGDNVYNPIPNEFIRDSNFDYIALGHIHKRTEISKLGRSYYSYCGTPYSGGFDETGDLGVYLGHVGKAYNDMKFVPIEGVRFIETHIRLEEYRSDARVAQFILEDLKARYPSSYRKDVFRLILRGEFLADVVPDMQAVEDILSENMVRPILRNEIVEPLDIKGLANEDSLKGLFVSKLLELMGDDDKKSSLVKEGTSNNSLKHEGGPDGNEMDLEAVLRIGIQAFEGEIKIDEDDFSKY